MKKFILYLIRLIVLPFVVFLINIFVDTHNSTKFYNRFIEDLNLNDSLIIRINLSERQLVKNKLIFKNPIIKI